MKKDLKHYLNIEYKILVSKEKDVYFVEIPCMNILVMGKDKNKALKELENKKILWLKMSIERKLPIPEPPHYICDAEDYEKRRPYIGDSSRTPKSFKRNFKIPRCEDW